MRNNQTVLKESQQLTNHSNDGNRLLTNLLESSGGSNMGINLNITRSANVNEQISQFKLTTPIPSNEQQSTSKQNIPFKQHQQSQLKLKHSISANKNQNTSYAATNKKYPKREKRNNYTMLNSKLNALNKNPSYHPYMRRKEDNFSDIRASSSSQSFPQQITELQKQLESKRTANENLSLLNEEARKLYENFFIPPVIVNPKNNQLGQKNLHKNIGGDQKSPELKTSENIQETEAAGMLRNASTKQQSTCNLTKDLQLKKQTLQKTGENIDGPINLILDNSEKQVVTSNLQKYSEIANVFQNTHKQPSTSGLHKNSKLSNENVQKSKEGKKKSENSTPLATGNNFQDIKESAGLFQNDSKKTFVSQDQQISQDKAVLNNSNERRQSLSQLDMVS